MAKYQHRLNEEIKVPLIQLVQDEKAPLEITAEKALEMAKDDGMDLVEINPNLTPPLCKIMDYGKYLYKKNKQEQEAKKRSKPTETKTIRFGFRTSDHDLSIKEKNARKFLEKGNMVKVQVMGRGRELIYKDHAFEKVKKFIANLEDIATVDGPPKMAGNTIISIIRPK